MRYLKAITALVISFGAGMDNGVTLHDWVTTALVTLGVFAIPNKDNRLTKNTEENNNVL